MPIVDDRTDVLKALVSKPVTTTVMPTVTRELANVVISLSSDLFELTRLIKGSNGSGLVARVQGIETDVKSILTKLEENRAAAAKAESDAVSASSNSPFAKLLKWFADKVLPSLISWLVLGAIGFTLAVWLHVRIQTGP